jgi:hypothetical protein
MRSARAPGFSSLAVICTLFVAHGCGGNSTTPTPAPAIVTVTSVAITGVSETTTVGQQVALKATATRSDGTTLDVTAQATWVSSNRAVADVSATGSLTTLAAGVTDIRATYSSVSGSLQLTVSLRPHLIGTVTDAGNGRPLSAAQIQLLDGANAGRTTQTDAAGSYSFDNLAPGAVTAQFSKAAYTTVTRSVTVSGETRLDVSLTAEPTAPDVSGFYGTFTISLTITHQSCGAFPVTMDPQGTLELSGRPDGSGFAAKLTERGVSRTYSGGRMNPNGTFGGFFSGLVPGLVPGMNVRLVPKHDASGSIQGTVSGRTVTGTEALTYGAPCPGGVIDVSLAGSR